ncbi:MAG: sensor histidine kinase [Pontixanthobacter sp.]
MTQMAGNHETRDGWRAFIDPDRPWVWLIYLPFYAFPWVFQKPTPIELVASATGLCVFLVVYLASARATDRLIWCVLAILGVALALAPFGGNWTVIAIYAAARGGEVREPRRAIVLIMTIVATIIATGLLTGQSFFWWGPGALLSVMVGGSNVSAAALRRKNAELLTAQDEVRALSRLAERERIARDLHDLIGRTLTLIAVKADLTRKLVGRDDAAARGEAEAIGTVARDGLKDVRAALSGMQRMGLQHEIAAARDILDAAGIACSVEGDAADMDPEQGAVLAMALREAVTNVVRHAEAKECRIVVAADGHRVSVEVADDGCGPSFQDSGFREAGGSFREGGGLAGIRARLNAAGGALNLAPGTRGTRLIASVPAA